jgi:hypothetical protein
MTDIQVFILIAILCTIFWMYSNSIQKPQIIEEAASSPGALIQLATSSPYGYPNYVAAGGMYRAPIVHSVPSYPIYRRRRPWWPYVPRYWW